MFWLIFAIPLLLIALGIWIRSPDHCCNCGARKLDCVCEWASRHTTGGKGVNRG